MNQILSNLQHFGWECVLDKSVLIFQLRRYVQNRFGRLKIKLSDFKTRRASLRSDKIYSSVVVFKINVNFIYRIIGFLDVVKLSL